MTGGWAKIANCDPELLLALRRKHPRVGDEGLWKVMNDDGWRDVYKKRDSKTHLCRNQELTGGKEQIGAWWCVVARQAQAHPGRTALPHLQAGEALNQGVLQQAPHLRAKAEGTRGEWACVCGDDPGEARGALGSHGGGQSPECQEGGLSLQGGEHG